MLILTRKYAKIQIKKAAVSFRQAAFFVKIANFVWQITADLPDSIPQATTK